MVHLYPHQAKAVSELHNGSVLWGGVGTGKSLTAVTYYIQNEAPKNVIVITTAKKRDSLDWDTEFSRYGVSGVPGATVEGLLTVDSWNNIGKYRDVKDSFFIFDEQRIVGAGSWVGEFLRIAKRNNWILLSATPGDNWLDYIPIFIANGFYKNRTEFKREHVVYTSWSKFPKVERYTNVNRLVKYRNQILVEMPYLRNTVRKIVEVPVEYNKELFAKVVKRKWHVFKDRPLRDVAELFNVMRKVVNSDSSRLEAVSSLLQIHPRLIVFYNFDYELEQLRTLATRMEIGTSTDTVEPGNWDMTSSSMPIDGSKSIPNTTSRKAATWSTSEPTLRPVGTISSELISTTKETESSTASVVIERRPPESLTRNTRSSLKQTPTFQVAEWNGHKHEPIPDTERWVYLVQYAAGSEGWNCIETDAMVFYSLTYSYKMWHQAHGRIDRLNTTYRTLHYYVLLSNSLIDSAIKKSLAAKQNFNISGVKGANWGKGSMK